MNCPTMYFLRLACDTGGPGQTHRIRKETRPRSIVQRGMSGIQTPFEPCNQFVDLFRFDDQRWGENNCVPDGKQEQAVTFRDGEDIGLHEERR